MASPITAAACTPRAVETARVVWHRRIADATWRIRLECPRLACQSAAGHFAMVRIAGRVDPLLGRPLAVYDTFRGPDDADPSGPPEERRHADFVYAVHGRFTTALATLRPGDEVTVWGPLGNGWREVPAVDRLLLVPGRLASWR